MSVTIQVRRDSAANWTSTNPVLHQGEIGLETDTGKSKMGDGATAWASLGYWQPFGPDSDNFTSLLTRAAVQTSNYTASANQIVPVDTTSGAVTVTLPNAPAAGTLAAVKMVTQGGTNTVTIACAGSDVFNKAGGVTTGTLTLLNQGMVLEYNAGIWTVLSDDLPLSQLDGRYVPGKVIAPSGDTSGATDTAAIQAAINAANGPVYLLTAIYYLNAPLSLVNGTQLIGLNDGGFGGTWSQVTELLLVNGANSSMIIAPSGANYWKLRGLLLSANGPGQTGPVQTGASGAAIHVADAVSAAELQAEIDQVMVYGSYNDALYIGNNRRCLRTRWSKYMAAGTGNTANPQAGNGVTINYSDHVFYACSVGGNQNHGFSLLAANSSSIRITDCDIFTNGQNWAAGTKTTVAAGSNGQAISGLTGAGVLNVASTTGFPGAGSLLLNLSSGPVIVSYTATTSTTFTGVSVSATAGNQGGTLATGQSVYLLGGDGIHIGTGCSGVWIGGNSVDRNYGCGINVESASQYAHHVVGNHFVSNSQAADGLLPHINLVSPGGQVAITGNGMEPVVAGATNRCNNFIYANGSGTWNDAANSYYFAALSTSAYTNNIQGIAPFSNGTFWVQGTNSGQVTAQIEQIAGQTAALLQAQDSSRNPLWSLDQWARPVVTSTGATTPTVAVGAGAGTGASATIANGDAAGNLSVTLGTGPAAGTLATVTFAHGYAGGTTPVVTLTPQNADAAHLNQFVFVTPTATSWVVSTISGVVFTGLTQPIWNFTVTGT